MPLISAARSRTVIIYECHHTDACYDDHYQSQLTISSACRATRAVSATYYGANDVMLQKTENRFACGLVPKRVGSLLRVCTHHTPPYHAKVMPGHATSQLSDPIPMRAVVSCWQSMQKHNKNNKNNKVNNIAVNTTACSTRCSRSCWPPLRPTEPGTLAVPRTCLLPAQRLS